MHGPRIISLLGPGKGPVDRQARTAHLHRQGTVQRAIPGNAPLQLWQLWHSKQRRICNLHGGRGTGRFDSHPRLHLESICYGTPWAMPVRSSTCIRPRRDVFSVGGVETLAPELLKTTFATSVGGQHARSPSEPEKCRIVGRRISITS
jgi:hypothetical protein